VRWGDRCAIRFNVLSKAGTIDCATSPTAAVYAPGQKSQWSNRYRLWRHTGKSAVDLVAPARAMLDNVRRLSHSYPLLCDQLLKRVMTRRLSSVDVKHLAGHELCRLQIHHAFDNVRRLAHSAHGV
jgi:hypothetical protein